MKLPILSGRAVVKALAKAGYEEVRQRRVRRLAQNVVLRFTHLFRTQGFALRQSGRHPVDPVFVNTRRARRRGGDRGADIKGDVCTAPRLVVLWVCERAL